MRRPAIPLVWIAAMALLQITSNAYGQLNDQPKQALRPTPKAEWVDSNTDAPNGTKYQTFKSKTLDADVSFLVYLPPDYETKTETRYPVIYWLHGLNGNQRAGAMMFVPRYNAAIRNGTAPPAIVVCVNGMVNSFYNDWLDDQRPVESVIVKDLVPHIDATFRTIASREGRMIQGFSMGGYGAAHLGFKYPEVFGSVVVDAGALILERALNGPAISPVFKGAWGDDIAKFKAEHPYQLIEKNAADIKGKTNIRVGCGLDDYLVVRNRELHERLNKLDIAHEYEEVPDVGHAPPKYYEGLKDKVFEIHRKAFESIATNK
jgi:enterochelin esterase-like enzyme